MQGNWTHIDANGEEISSSSGGASAFTGLNDAPSSYIGEALKAVRVKADESGLEFATISSGGLTQQQIEGLI